MSARIRRGVAADGHAQLREEHAERVPHAAPRGVVEGDSPTARRWGPYRGAGRPEGNYYMERLIDEAAAEMGIDRLELPPAQPACGPRSCRTRPPPTDLRQWRFCKLFEKALQPHTQKRASKGESKKTGKAARPGDRQLPRGDCAANRRWAGPLRGRRRRHLHQRHARLRQGHAAPFAQCSPGRLGSPGSRKCAAAAGRGTRTSSVWRRATGGGSARR